MRDVPDGTLLAITGAMPSVETKYFGALPYTDESLFDFPQGLPAFEDQKGFVLIEFPEKAPLVFLQSVARASLCFVALPVQMVDQKHQLAIAPEDLEDLALDTRRQPVVGADVMVLALVSLHGEFLATANLMAPIVLNVKTRRGLQAIRRDTRYSHEHPLSGQAAHQSSGADIC
ncbi:MAG TPA: flagellar assembly protein FliW [Bryobacteraceae bacterium]|nr:flagellar assembly protein FliW [Bryobacteraceae bacterium]